MAKEYDFSWRAIVPETLRRGAYFDRWDEEIGLMESNCFFQVDEYAFFLYWMTEGKDAQVLDLIQASEARRGGVPKDPKFAFDVEEQMGKENLEERSITIVSGLDYVNVSYTHMVAQDEKTAKDWCGCLQKMLHNFRVYHVCPYTCLIKHWKMLCLSVNERRKIPVRSITRTFASGKTEKMIMQCLIELGLCLGKKDEIEPSDFTFEKFYDLYLKICPRTDVQELFQQISFSNDSLTIDQLVVFLNDQQRDPRLNEILFPHYDKNRAIQLVVKYDRHEECLGKDRLCFDGFLRYLMSDDNAPVFLDRVEIYQQMDQPLCHYFISSSHNTYLTGRQFGGRSSVEIYRQVLLSGCRCIELDCWDGTGDDRGEPIITHGKAMCTDVLFRDVIMAIRDTAFVTSEYPVILSFENHCSRPNQLKMAVYCMEILDDLLLSKPLDTHPLEPGIPLPSPAQLKRKILIKNKRLKPDEERRQLDKFLKEGRIEEDVEEPENPEISVGEESRVNRVDTFDSSNDDSSVNTVEMLSRSTSIENPKLRKQTTNRAGSAPISGVVDEAHPELKAPEASSFKSKLKSLARMNTKEVQPALSTEEEQRLLQMYHYTGATIKIHPLLSSLINYTQPVRFQSFEASEQANCHFHMSSFSESMGLGLLKSSALEFVNYNKRQLGRIYPKGGRVDSSNFLPQIFWNAGVQMAALNFQTPDLAMQLNQGRFEYNGNCGYLLKPDFMRRPDRMFDPFSESPVDGVIAAFCSIRVISGQFLSDKKIGTYVEAEMYGLPTDTIRKEFRTRIVPSNGLNPFYNEEPFVFRKVVLPELAVFRIAVYDENNKLLGQRILPLDGLQAGYRHICLRTDNSLPMTLPTIFCHIILKTYVPKGLAELVDALADPRAHLMEKRQKQMEQMGIAKDDIEEIPTSSVTSLKALTAKGSSSNLLSIKNPPTQHSALATANSVKVQSQNKDDKEKLTTASSQPQLTSLQLQQQQFIPLTFETIKIEDLKKDKLYLKLIRKHCKEMEEFEKLHSKRQGQLEKQQCSAIEKIMADQGKKRLSTFIPANKCFQLPGVVPKQSAPSFAQPPLEYSSDTYTVIERRKSGGACVQNSAQVHNLDVAQPNNCAPRGSSLPQPLNDEPKLLDSSHVTSSNQVGYCKDPALQSTVSQQTVDWSNLLRQQIEQRHALRKAHEIEQWDLVKKLLEEAHHKQLNLLKQHFEMESKALKLQQTKKSMEDSKSINADKTIKTKGERARRLKESQEQNLKVFVEERKRLVVKHQKPEDHLRKRQVEERELVEKEAKRAIEIEELAYKEALLAIKPETLV